MLQCSSACGWGTPELLSACARSSSCQISALAGSRCACLAQITVNSCGSYCNISSCSTICTWSGLTVACVYLSCIFHGILVLHRQKGNCCLRGRPLWPVLPERTTLIGYTHLYRLLWKDKSCPAFTYLVMEMEGMNIISILEQHYFCYLVWFRFKP